MAAATRFVSSRCAGASTIASLRVTDRTTPRSRSSVSRVRSSAMAHKKAGGSSRNGRDSQAKRLGVKTFGGELVPAGSIIIRQRGTRVHPGLNVGMGKDHTLFAKITGRIEFSQQGVAKRKTVSVVPA